MSRRTRRADQQQPAPAHSTIVSNNPIFFREDDDPVHALVHDVLDDVPAAVVKPLPLPPSRAHPPVGSRAAGSALVMSKHGSGWVLRRVPRDDPFLAAYVACTKGGKVDAAPVNRQRRKQKKDKNRGDTVLQGCGIWSGWAAGARLAGAMSCKYVCDVVPVQGDGRPSAAAAAQAQAQASPVPRLHLSRQLVVIPARKRALARGRAQG